MDEAFIIMQIGDPALDALCDEAIVPAIEAAGLSAKRVDRDNQGELLKVEIVDFIERASIIVADLTNERPNCYLEVGYAMGLGKKRNLILTVREDHHHSSSNYNRLGPKIHFDLEGYDILFWSPDAIPKFRADLEQRIRTRLAILAPGPQGEPRGTERHDPRPDQEWLTAQRASASEGLQKIDREAYVEFTAALSPQPTWKQSQILSAVRESQVGTFGWPINLVLDKDPHRPVPRPDGVSAEVIIPKEDSLFGHASYDYWYVRGDGDYYMRQSLFEDERDPGSLFFDTRVVRTTEMLLFLARLYARLDVPTQTQVSIEMTISGLDGRVLTSANTMRSLFNRPTCRTDVVVSQLTCSIADLEAKLTDNVMTLLSPVFSMFEFFELSDQVYRELVEAFVAGRVT